MERSSMNNLSYYFGGDRGFDTLTLIMKYLGESHRRKEVRRFLKRIEELITKGTLEDYRMWCQSTERPLDECWHG